MKKSFLLPLMLISCTSPAPKPTEEIVEKEQTAEEWKIAHCIGAKSACADKPAGIPQRRVERLANAALWSPATDPEAHGWGRITTGGTTPCLVSNTGATGAGSFSSCARQSGTYITFSSPGPYVVDSQQTYLGGNNTIDGCGNGQIGVTLSQKSDKYRAVVAEGVSNIAIRCIRFEGEGKPGTSSVEHDLFAADGTDSAVSKIFIDRSTFIKGSDGALDVTGNTSDVTVQRSLIYGTGLASLVKYGNRARLTFYQNALLGNCERNPQIKGTIEGFLWASSVSGPEASPQIIDGGNGLPFKDCYGMRAWEGSDSPGVPKGNIIDSAFYGQSPWTVSSSGVYAARNIGGTNTGTQYNIPAQFLPPNVPNTGLKALLPSWGSPNKTQADKDAIVRAVALLPGSGGPTPTPTPSPTVSPTVPPTVPPTTPPSPSPSPSPSPTPAPGTGPEVVSSTCGSKMTKTLEGDTTKLSFKWSWFAGTCVVVVK